MDPISDAMQVIGLGMSIFGAVKGSQDAAAAHAAQLSIARDEAGVNEQKRQQMELDANRQQLQTFRNAQRARAAGINAATNQGAQFGSGLPGGLAQTEDASLNSSLAINQNLAIGRNIFQQNMQMSFDKVGLSNAQSDQATDAGWASLGQSVMKAGPSIGATSKDIFAGFGKIFS